MDLNPLFSHPVKDIYCIKSFFIRPSSTKNNNSIILWIITHGAIWPLWWNISSSFYLSPLHCCGIERPNIIHINRFLIMIKLYMHNPQRIQFNCLSHSSYVPIGELVDYLRWGLNELDAKNVFPSLLSNRNY